MNKLLTIISILVFTPFSLFAQTDTTLYSTYSEYELDTTLYSDSSEPGYYEEDRYEDPTENSLGGTMYSELTKVVNTETLNIREGMGTQYGIVGQIKSGDVVRVEEENGRWSLIETGDGIRGYVANKYLYENYDNLPVGSYDPNTSYEENYSNNSTGKYIFWFIVGIIALKFIKNFGGSGSKERNNSEPFNTDSEKQSSINGSKSNKIVTQNLTHYGCSKCGKFTKQSSHPNNQGCSSGGSHSWVRLGKLGTTVYCCSKCIGVLNCDSHPNNNGCSAGVGHSWVRLGTVGSTTYSCSKCGVDVATDSHPNNHGCSAGGGHSWNRL